MFNVGDYVIVRTKSAGHYAGYFTSREGQEAVLSNARKLWYWEGANNLGDMALNGVKFPKKCKFPAPTPFVLLMETIEILPVSFKAQECIESVPVWSAH